MTDLLAILSCFPCFISATSGESHDRNKKDNSPQNDYRPSNHPVPHDGYRSVENPYDRSCNPEPCRFLGLRRLRRHIIEHFDAHWSRNEILHKKITGKGTSSTRASLQSGETCGFQPLRFAFEAWTALLPAWNLFRDLLDFPSPETVCRRNLRTPFLANTLPASPRRPLQLARFRRHAGACSSALDSRSRRDD